MAVALKGEYEAVILTGGLSRSAYITDKIREYAGWLGDFVVMAGEFEMEALAAAALRAEQGTEPVKHYTGRSVFAGLEEKS
jgi:butyrate kinase